MNTEEKNKELKLIIIGNGDEKKALVKKLLAVMEKEEIDTIVLTEEEVKGLPLKIEDKTYILELPKRIDEPLPPLRRKKYKKFNHYE